MLDLTQPIRTLGLHQPYAGLILHGKTIETRWILNGRKPPFPLGPYLIYSTKDRYEFEEFQFVGGIKQALRITERWNIKDMTTKGMALCIVQLIRVVDPLDSSYSERSFVDPSEYTDSTHRLIGLEFDAITRIEPFPIRGKQGIGFLSDADRAKIKFAL